MTDHTELLVVGAGPYAYSAAARDNGIGTRIVGGPMSLWREQMPTECSSTTPAGSPVGRASTSKSAWSPR